MFMSIKNQCLFVTTQKQHMNINIKTLMGNKVEYAVTLCWKEKGLYHCGSQQLLIIQSAITMFPFSE